MTRSGPRLNRMDEVIDHNNEGVSRHLGHIADSMSQWEGRIAEHLGLTAADTSNIKTKYPSDLHLQTREALLIWMQRLGRRATYRELIKVFEDAGYNGYAEIVRGLVSAHKHPQGRVALPHQGYSNCCGVIISVATLVAVFAVCIGYYNVMYFSSSPSESKLKPETMAPSYRGEPTTAPPGTSIHGLTAAEEKIINDPRSKGPEVVDLCLKKLKTDSFNMHDDNDFMRRIAYVMSEFGSNIENNGGIWQLTLEAFEDTKATSAHLRLPRKYKQITEAFGIDWMAVKYKDLEKPFFSALAARLYLSNFAELIPPAHRIDKQASYWKNLYMRGKGNTQTFVARVNELEQTRPYRS